MSVLNVFNRNVRANGEIEATFVVTTLTLLDDIF
jgi:hypothetical protein